MSLVLAGPVATWGAWPLYRAAWYGLGYGSPAQVGALVIPAHGTLTLTFRHAGTVTIDATVTGPGTPLVRVPP